MTRGCPAKKKRNISGLKNQPAASDIRLTPIPESAEQNANNQKSAQDDSQADHEMEDDQPQQDMKDQASSEQEDNLDSEFESDYEWEGLTSIELGKKLAIQCCKIDDNNDTDWIPYRLRPKRKQKSK